MSDDSHRLVVLKFGGTSVARPENWQSIHGILEQRIDEGVQPIVVCSALSGVSNKLESLPALIRNGEPTAPVIDLIRAKHDELAEALELDCCEPYQRTLDNLTLLVESQKPGEEVDSWVCAEIIAHGELLSTRIGQEWLREQGMHAVWRDARDWLTSIDGLTNCTRTEYLSAVCDFQHDPDARNGLRSTVNSVVVTQGFIARNNRRQTVLLGRGGSDTAATYIAAKLGASAVEIWTDVPGVFTANPHELADAKLLRHLSYEEAEAFASHGAKVLHPRCLEPLRKAGIPLSVHWTAHPTFPGTRIDGDGRTRGVKGVSGRRGLCLVTMELEESWRSIGFVADVAACFKECGLSVDLLATSPTRIQMTIDPSVSPGFDERVEALVGQLNALCKATLQTNVSSISLVGRDIRACMHEFAPFMRILRRLDLLMVAQAANDLHLTFVVPDAESKELLERIHHTLFSESGLTPTHGPAWSELTKAPDNVVEEPAPVPSTSDRQTMDNVFKRYESEVRSYSRAFPRTFAKARGARLWDENGQRYVDFLAGCGSLNYGHNNPIMKQALLDYIESDAITLGLDMQTGAKRDFIHSMQEAILGPRELDHVMQFTGPTGTNAVEAALKIARKVTGRTNVISFTNGFHGVSTGSLAATGNQYNRGAAGVPLYGTTVMPFDGYFGPEVNTVGYIERLLTDPSSGVDYPAAMIVEPVQGEGGLNAASPEWLQGIRELCTKHDILLIVDEIQAGCGRTGTFFAFEPSGIKPDIITLSKSLSGYGLPFAMVLIERSLDVWAPAEHNGTFRGNNHAFVTAAATIDNYWRDDEFEKSVQEKSRILGDHLQSFVERFKPHLIDVRGRGMMQGIRCQDPNRAKAVTSRAFENGLIIERSGPEDEVIKCLMPLTIRRDELSEGLEILERALVAEFGEGTVETKKREAS